MLTKEKQSRVEVSFYGRYRNIHFFGDLIASKSIAPVVERRYFRLDGQFLNGPIDVYVTVDHVRAVLRP